MGKTSAAVKNAWAARNYDKFTVLLPKGRKEQIKKLISPQSLNSFINQAINEKIEKMEETTMKYRVKAEFIDLWYGGQSTDEIEQGQRDGATMHEIERLSAEWGKPVDDLMEQLEEII